MNSSKPTINSFVAAGLSSVLRARRLALGISQAELAERAGLHRTYISEVERAAQNLTMGTLGRLADALETSILSLIEQANNEACIMSRRLEILLCEDNEADIHIIECSLKGLKDATNLHVVRDGRSTMEFLHKKGNYEGAPVPDLIVLDLHLPKKSGFEILEEIKKDASLKKLPVVVLTNSAASHDMEKSYLLQASTFITKPSNQRQFQDAMATLVEYWSSVARRPGA